MTEVASKDLCAELYQLSGWQDKSQRMIFNEKDDGSGLYKNYLGTYYSLGYLLRKLPQSVMCSCLDLFANRDSQWTASYEANELDEDFMPGYWKTADTPEDAACKLSIELFKQGVLKRDI